MSQSLKEIAKRIVVCGVEELASLLERKDIALVVSTCSQEECKDNFQIISADGEVKTTSAQTLIDMASLKNIEQYKSLLYQTYGDFLDQYTPDQMTKEEEQAYFYEQAIETLEAIDEALQTHPNKKVIIHCVHGSDRSAMVALAYFVKHQGANASIDEAIKTLHSIRPGAGLDGIAQQFQAYFAENFEQYKQAIVDYRDVLAINEKVPPSMRAKDFLMATGLSETSHAEYKAIRERFEMSLPTLTT